MLLPRTTHGTGSPGNTPATNVVRPARPGRATRWPRSRSPRPTRRRPVTPTRTARRARPDFPSSFARPSSRPADLDLDPLRRRRPQPPSTKTSTTTHDEQQQPAALVVDLGGPAARRPTASSRRASLRGPRARKTTTPARRPSFSTLFDFNPQAGAAPQARSEALPSRCRCSPGHAAVTEQAAGQVGHRLVDREDLVGAFGSACSALAPRPGEDVRRLERGTRTMVDRLEPWR